MELVGPFTALLFPQLGPGMALHSFPGYISSLTTVGGRMDDMRAHLERLRAQIAECELIRDLATDPKKRDLFSKLAQHYEVLAGEIEKAIDSASLG
jgi:hypothetical protein